MYFINLLIGLYTIGELTLFMCVLSFVLTRIFSLLCILIDAFFYVCNDTLNSRISSVEDP